MNTHIPTDFSGDAILKELDRPIHLKLSFLLPLGLVFATLIFSFIYLTFERSQRQIAIETEQSVTSITTMFRHNILENSNMMEAVSHALLRNKEIEAALKEKSRARLLSLSTKLFNELSKEHLITHFYYHDTDRTNLLRVHKPERHSDKINRFTMLEAESLGSFSTGIELGTLGTFTLRHVSPWFDSNQRLIGYIELGMEIDNIFDSIEHLFNTPLFMLINKKYLNKKAWVEGMEMLGYDANWDMLNQSVITNLNSSQPLSNPFTKNYATAEAIASGKFDLEYNGSKQIAQAIPIMDKGNRDIGNIWILIDIDEEASYSLMSTIIATTITVTLGIILFIIFFRLVSNIESELSKHHSALHKIASHDSLTAVYNRRSFDTIIAKEVERAHRYKRDLSLLLIDIDHFKQVNDNFGHQTGDEAIGMVAKMLLATLRDYDITCRYGGEEYLIVLPATGLTKALETAERIREIIENEVIRTRTGQEISLTVSCGVSSIRPHESLDSLTYRADNALYIAKEDGRNLVRHLE